MSYLLEFAVKIKVEGFQQNPWEIIARHIDISLPSALCEHRTQNQPHTNLKRLKQNTLLIIVELVEQGFKDDIQRQKGSRILNKIPKGGYDPMKLLLNGFEQSTLLKIQDEQCLEIRFSTRNKEPTNFNPIRSSRKDNFFKPFGIFQIFRHH